MVSSTVGSCTRTVWNRRSSAGSFSIYWRYSSSVVAPMQCSSPRASIGFNRLPASIEPSVLPAPTMVCSSSINRMMRPSDFLTSASTAFRRSSNSPRYFAPAINAPISSEKIVLSCKDLGTSFATIRCARPSTMAVLPTPGSPMRTGLFFVLRDRMRMTFRISSSRPMTGSIFCSRARLTRSVPYLASASYVSSGVSDVTRWLPRTDCSACRQASFVIWYGRNRPFSTASAFSIRDKNRCSTETYSSFICFAMSSALFSAVSTARAT